MCKSRFGASSPFCTKENTRIAKRPDADDDDTDLKRTYRAPTLSAAKQGRVNTIFTNIRNLRDAPGPGAAPASGGAPGGTRAPTSAPKCELTKANLKDALTDASDADAVYRQCLRATKTGGDCTANRGNDCKKVFGGTKKTALAAMSPDDKKKVQATRKVFREAVATRLQARNKTALLASKFDAGGGKGMKVAISSDDFKIVAEIPEEAITGFADDREIEVGSIEAKDLVEENAGVIPDDVEVFYADFGGDLAVDVSVTFPVNCEADKKLGKPLLKATSADDNDWTRVPPSEFTVGDKDTDAGTCEVTRTSKVWSYFAEGSSEITSVSTTAAEEGSSLTITASIENGGGVAAWAIAVDGNAVSGVPALTSGDNTHTVTGLGTGKHDVVVTITSADGNVLDEAEEHVADTWSSETEVAPCFPSDALVTLADGGGEKTMGKLRVGDKVLVGGGKGAGPNMYSEVFLFSHRFVDATATFVQLKTASTTLELTPGHYLYVNRTKLVPARAVRPGDRVTLASGELAAVAAIASVRKEGIINPHTLQGDIVVNGVLTSTYTRAFSPTLAHVVLAPLRALYRAGVDIAKADVGAALDGLPNWWTGAWAAAA